MRKLSATALLLIALALPVALFVLLRSNFHVNDWVAAAIGVVAGWASNVTWASIAQGANAEGASQSGGDTLSIAMRFGWICPVVLVFLTWFIGRLVT